MRDIKARAWDKRNQIMIYGAMVATPTHALLTTVLDLQDPFAYFDGLVWMLASGLKDINQKEIFEGDLIKFLGNWDETGQVLPPSDQIYRVSWIMGGLVAVPHELNFSSSPVGWKGVGHTNSEIVGNIFENPELNPF